MTRAEDVDAAIERAKEEPEWDLRTSGVDAARQTWRDRALLAEEVVRLRAKRRASVFREDGGVIEISGYSPRQTERLLALARKALND